MKYDVTFFQAHTYSGVEADSEEEAIQKALPDFESDMRRPIANTGYDDVEVNYSNNDDEEED